MVVELNLLISLLRLTGNGSVLIESVNRDARIPSYVTEKLLQNLQNQELIYLKNDMVEADTSSRLKLAVKAVSLGADVEQVEPGDTLLHTFIVTPWPQCQRRHYFYWATIAGEKSVSSTSMLYDIRHGDETTTNFLCTPNIPIAVYGFHYNPPFQQNYGNYILARNADYGTVVSIPSATPVGQMRGDDHDGQRWLHHHKA